MSYQPNYQQQGGQSVGGFQKPQGPPVDPQVAQWFQTVDRDGSGHVSVVELQQALVNGNMSSFSTETITMLFNMFDADRSGTIGLQEFAGIFAYINQWQSIFSYYDKDRSGQMSAQELSAAMQQFGYNLPPKTLNLLLAKYGTPTASASGRGGGFSIRQPQSGVSFDAFIRCCVSVRALTDAFRKVDTQGQGQATLHYQQFLDMVLAAP